MYLNVFKNILTVNVKITVYKSLIQLIVFNGIAFWSNAFDTHIKKVHILNFLVKYIFNKRVSSQQLLYIMNVKI